MNLYLIYCESYKKMQKEVNKIVTTSLNVIKYDLRQNTLLEVINEANYFSLTGEKKYIIVKSGNLFKSGKSSETEKDLKLLEKYLECPNKNTCIIFTSTQSVDKRLKIYKKINEIGKVISIESLNKKDLTYHCMDLLKEKKYQIDYENANFIVENSYVNYDIMLNELEKIYTLIKPCKLDKFILKDVISISMNDKTFAYINSIITRDFSSAVNNSKDFETLKIDPAMIIIMLYKEFKILYLLLSGVDEIDIQKKFRKESWQMKNYLINKRLYKLSEVKKIITKLFDYDYKYKTGLLDKSVILDLINYDLCD